MTQKISGKMLKNNLLRDSDLAVETDLLYIDIDANRVGINTNTPSVDLDVNGNIVASEITTDTLIVDTSIDVGDLTLSDSIFEIPTGDTASRPGSPAQGYIRFNTTNGSPEIYDGSDWVGFTPQFVDLYVESFISDGSSSSYVLGTSNAVSEDSLLVDIDGIVQRPGPLEAYTFDSETNTITFTEMPDIDNTITVRQITNVTDVRGIGNVTGTDQVLVESGEIKIIHSDIEQLVFDGSEAIISTTLRPDTNGGQDLGTSDEHFDNLYVDYINGFSADIAERFESDKEYEPGTVVVINNGGVVTACSKQSDSMVVGIVSTSPAYVLNAYAKDSVAVGLTGTLPCKVIGTIKPGNLLVTSDVPGCACAMDNYIPGTVFAKALEYSENIGIIKVLVWSA